MHKQTLCHSSTPPNPQRQQHTLSQASNQAKQLNRPHFFPGFTAETPIPAVAGRALEVLPPLFVRFLTVLAGLLGVFCEEPSAAWTCALVSGGTAVSSHRFIRSAMRKHKSSVPYHRIECCGGAAGKVAVILHTESLLTRLPHPHKAKQTMQQEPSEQNSKQRFTLRDTWTESVMLKEDIPFVLKRFSAKRATLAGVRGCQGV